MAWTHTSIWTFRKISWKKSWRKIGINFRKKSGIMSGIGGDSNKSQILTKCLGQVSKKGTFETQSRHFYCSVFYCGENIFKHQVWERVCQKYVPMIPEECKTKNKNYWQWWEQPIVVGLALWVLHMQGSSTQARSSMNYTQIILKQSVLWGLSLLGMKQKRFVTSSNGADMNQIFPIASHCFKFEQPPAVVFKLQHCPTCSRVYRCQWLFQQRLISPNCGENCHCWLLEKNDITKLHLQGEEVDSVNEPAP